MVSAVSALGIGTAAAGDSYVYGPFMHRWSAAYTEAGSEVTDAGGVALLEEGGGGLRGFRQGARGDGGVERALGGGYRAGVMIAEYMKKSKE